MDYSIGQMKQLNALYAKKNNTAGEAEKAAIDAEITSLQNSFANIKTKDIENVGGTLKSG